MTRLSYDAGRMTVVDLPTADRWLDLNELAHYLGCSKRALSYDIAKYRETSDPFPVEMIYGRLKAKVKDAEAWLERHDRKRRVA
jgi:predicted DNA-binding transcriptional regulator AlpA